MKKRILAAVLALAALFGAMIPASAVTYDDRGNELKVITIDPGHGGLTGTAQTYGGVKYTEEALNLKIANYCKEYLEENYWNVVVYMTRENNKDNPGLAERVEFAAERNSDYLLSIHLNGLNGKNRGALALVPVGIYNPTQGKMSRDGAQAILEELEVLGVKNRGFQENTLNSTYPDGSKRDAYYLVRYGVEMNVPTVIMEQCFMDNYSDFMAFLSSEDKLRELGIANAKGLARVLGLEDISLKPIRYPSSAENGDTPFDDVYQVQHWFYDDVTYVYENGLMMGMAEDAFEPLTGTSRAMVVTLLHRLNGDEEAAETVTFPDVAPEAWYYEAVEWACRTGVTQGVEESLFAPDRKVTREQFVTFLYRYAQLMGYRMDTEEGWEEFADAGKIADYAAEPVRWAVQRGLVLGYDDGTFGPQRELTRGELAALICRFDGYLMEEDFAEEEPPAEETEPGEPEVPEETEEHAGPEASASEETDI